MGQEVTDVPIFLGADSPDNFRVIVEPVPGTENEFPPFIFIDSTEAPPLTLRSFVNGWRSSMMP